MSFEKYKAHLSYIFVFLCSLTIYTLTLSTDVHLEDDGGFIMAAFHKGISHPPGYPFYTLATNLFTHIEISTIAARVHFASAVYGAIAVTLITALSYLLCRSLTASIIAGLTIAFIEIFWSQSIIAETYTLNCAIFMACTYLAIKWHLTEKQGHKKDSIILLLTLGVLCGFGLSTHWPLFILSSTAIIIPCLLNFRTLIKNIHWPILGLAVGLTPYIWMYAIGESKNTFIAFGPITSLDEFIYYVKREGYKGVDHAEYATFQDKLNFIQFFFVELQKNLGYIPLALIAIGASSSLRKRTLITASLLLSAAGSSILLALLLGFSFSGFHQILFRVYPLPAYCILGVFIALGISVLSAHLHTLKLQPLSKIQLPLIMTTLCFLIPAELLISNYTFTNNSHDTWEKTYFQQIIASLPKDTILITNDDTDTGIFGYEFFVNRNIRTDIDVRHSSGIFYPNRLVTPYTDKQDRDKTMLDFYQSTTKPIIFTSNLNLAEKQINHGALYSLKTSNIPDEMFTELRHALLKKISYDFSVPLRWQNIHKQILAKRLLDYYLQTDSLNTLSSTEINSLLSHFDAAVFFLQQNQALILDNPQLYEQHLKQTNSLTPYSLSNKTSSHFYLLKANYAIHQKADSIGIIQDLEKSLTLHPSINNEALPILLSYYKKNNEVQKQRKLQKRFKISIQ